MVPATLEDSLLQRDIQPYFCPEQQRLKGTLWAGAQAGATTSSRVIPPRALGMVSVMLDDSGLSFFMCHCRLRPEVGTGEEQL